MQRLIKIFNHFGYKNQLLKLEEEFNEIKNEMFNIFDLEMPTKDHFINLRDELGDMVNVVDGILINKYGITPEESSRKQDNKIGRTCNIIEICKDENKTYEEVRNYVE